MQKIRVAIIGQGRSGRDIHGHYFLSDKNTDYQVTAIVDALEERRERAAREYGCPVFEKVGDLYGRKDIDLVVNSTFSHMHAPVTIDLLNHGFNVICEKPVAKTYEDGCRMIRAAEANRRLFAPFQQSRFSPIYRKIREILDTGKLGEIIQIDIRFSGFQRRYDWQTSLDYAGGNVRNTGPHPLDQAMDLLGFPEKTEVFSKLACVNTAGDAEDYAKIMLSVPGKPLIDVEISSCDTYQAYMYKVQGHYGTLKATAQHIDLKYYDPKTHPMPKQIMEPLFTAERTPAYCSEKLNWQEEQYDVQGDAFDTAVPAYYAMIRDTLTDGKPLVITPQQVLSQLKVIDIIHAQNPLAVR